MICRLRASAMLMHGSHACFPITVRMRISFCLAPLWSVGSGKKGSEEVVVQFYGSRIYNDYFSGVGHVDNYTAKQYITVIYEIFFL